MKENQIFQESLFFSWLLKKNDDEITAKEIIDSLRAFNSIYCSTLGKTIEIPANRKITVPFSINLNPFLWIQDCLNRNDYETINFIKFYYKLLITLILQESMVSPEETLSIKERLNISKLKPYLIFKGKPYQHSIVFDSIKGLSFTFNLLYQNGNFPAKIDIVRWQKVWQIFMQFIKIYVNYYKAMSEVLVNHKLIDSLHFAEKMELIKYNILK